ncbi:MAG: tetratricopeptide repeat protein [Gammaproteobacteria bacterium]|nr:tetratricopeptide repeat protein [Gammaproteobacteria bacterium]
MMLYFQAVWNSVNLRWIFSILFTLSAYTWAAVLPPVFEKGVAAFEKGDFQLALDSFQKAEQLGMDTSTLHYNLGVCYYKLKNYNQAEKQFVLVTKDKNMAQLAHYNLGLTVLRMDKKPGALAWFKLAAASNQNAKLTALAYYQMHKIDASYAEKPQRYSAGASIAYGNDDNVTLVATDSPSHQSDKYLEALLYLTLPMTEHLFFSGAIYRQDYSTVNTADFTQYDASFGYSLRADQWRLTPEAGFAESQLGGRGFQKITDYKLTLRRGTHMDGQWLLRYRYSVIHSDNTVYDYLQGNRHQFRAQYTHPGALGQMRLRYERETNQRQNTATTNYSPTRDDVRFRLEQTAHGVWGFSQELQYRESNYGAIAAVARKDKRKLLLLEANRKLTEDIAVGLRYSHGDNSSNITTYKYHRNDTQLFCDFKF